MNMKKTVHWIKKGFTLVELLVVIAILGIVMTMAAGVLRDAGKGRGIESGVDLLESLVTEARATAQGNDTYTRVFIVADPKDTSQNSIHLRYLGVQMFRKDTRNGGNDGTLHPGSIHTVNLQNHFHINAVFIRGFRCIRPQSCFKENFVPGNTTDDDIGIADIHCQNHTHSSKSSSRRMRQFLILPFATSISPALPP